MAERVGFEPTCPLLAGKTLSRRPRYDRFGTSPSFIESSSHPVIEPLTHRGSPSQSAWRAATSISVASLPPPAKEIVDDRNAFFGQNPLRNLDSVIELGVVEDREG